MKVRAVVEFPKLTEDAVTPVDVIEILNKAFRQGLNHLEARVLSVELIEEGE